MVGNFYFYIHHTKLSVDCKWGEWETWESCSATCGNGFHKVTRNRIREAMYGGEACAGDFVATRPCNLTPCPDDCTWGDWGQWGPCSQSCGGGIRLRNRIISRQAEHGGNCIPSSTDMELCNDVECPTGKNDLLYQSIKQIDPFFGGWPQRALTQLFLSLDICQRFKECLP